MSLLLLKILQPRNSLIISSTLNVLKTGGYSQRSLQHEIKHETLGMQREGRMNGDSGVGENDEPEFEKRGECEGDLLGWY